MENKIENKKILPTKQTIITRENCIHFLKNFISTQLTTTEAEQFIAIAIACNLNPLKREIYCIPYKTNSGSRKLSIVTGYEVYIKRAERSGLLRGWNVYTSGSIKTNDLVAHIKILRHEWQQPFEYSVDSCEYVQPTTIWRTKPKTMIKKVVIGTGFRLCFSEELGGMPYTHEELPIHMVTNNLTVPKEQNKQNPTVEILNKKLFEKRKELRNEHSSQ